MGIAFTKMQGTGNDFILIDEFIATVIPDDMKGQFAACYCDRRYGIGADGVLYLSKGKDNALKMRLFQPDESEVEMCGNGIRCFAKYAFDEGYIKESCSVETRAGPVDVVTAYKDEEFSATVSMPAPTFDRKDIPATGEGEYKERIGEFDVYAVNTGVPHAVIPVPSVEAVALPAIAPAIRHHSTFPNGANVDVVEKTGEKSISIRTFERGVEAETLSCGTGATASAAVMQRLGLVGNVVEVDTAGGMLVIILDGKVRLKGPAVTVFKGYIRV